MSDNISLGSDCKDLFRSAYLNRYTWSEAFTGYKGKCRFSSDQVNSTGSFILTKNSKPQVENIHEPDIVKAISSQLWEVSIHRVRRSFKDVHGDNTFTAGELNDIGREILVGGKNKGDKYAVKDNIVTMVYRNMHGVIINIYTTETIDTSQGYLSKSYTSTFLDPETFQVKGNTSFFLDKFVPLYKNGPWVLSDRQIDSKDQSGSKISHQRFSFIDLTTLD